MSTFQSVVGIVGASGYIKDNLDAFYPFIKAFVVKNKPLLITAKVPFGVIDGIENRPKGALKKQYFEEAFACILLSKEVFDTFVKEQMPPKFGALLEEVLVTGQMSVGLVRERHFECVQKEEVKTYYNTTTSYRLRPFMHFFVWGTSLYGSDQSTGWVKLEPAMLRWLRQMMPRPALATVVPMSQPKGLQTFSAEQSIFSELPRIISADRVGMLAVGKNGKYLESSLKKMQETLEIQDLYTKNAKHKFLYPIRFRLLANMLEWMNLNEPSPLKLLKNAVEAFKKGNELAVDQGYNEIEQLLPHLSGAGYLDTWNRDAKIAAPHILRLLKQLAVSHGKAWISMAQFVNSLSYDELLPLPVEVESAKRSLYISVESKYGKDKIAITTSSYAKLISIPFVRGSVTLLASLGMIDLAYDEPDTALLGDTFFSYFDGVKAFSINNLGLYMLGLYSDYIPPKVKGAVDISLSETDLMVLLSAEDATKEKVFEFYGEKITNRRFLISNGSFLRNCTSRSELNLRIENFRYSVDGAKIPENWETFFVQLQQKVVRLPTEEQIKVIQLPVRNKPLVHLIATHPDFRDVVIKAEGMRILVEDKHTKKFKDLLKQHGYLIE